MFTFLFFSRDVFDGQQDHLRPAMRFDAPRVQDHMPQSEMLEFMAHFKTVDARVVGGDLVKQFAQLRQTIQNECREESSNHSLWSLSDPPQDLSHNLPLSVFSTVTGL